MQFAIFQIASVVKDVGWIYKAFLSSLKKTNNLALKGWAVSYVFI